MYIEDVSIDQIDRLEIFHVERSILWNNHEVVILNQKNHPDILCALSIRNEWNRPLASYKGTIQPMMSGGGRVKGDASYSERDGWGGKLTIEFEFGPKEQSNDKDKSSRNEQTDNKQSRDSSDVDSRDRDFDKDK